MRHDHHQGTNTTSPTNSQHTTKQTNIHKISHSQTPKPTAKRRNPPNSNLVTQTSKPHTETHARNKNPAPNTNPCSPKHKFETQASPKHKAETQAQLETQNRNVENRE